MDKIYVLFFPGNYYRLPYHQRSQDFIRYLNTLDEIAKICLVTIRTLQTPSLVRYIMYMLDCARGALAVTPLNERMLEVGMLEPTIPRRVRRLVPVRVVNLLCNSIFPNFLAWLFRTRFDQIKKAVGLPHRGIFDVGFFASCPAMTIGLALKKSSLIRFLVYKDQDILPVLKEDASLWRVEERMSREADLVVSVSETLRKLRIRQGARRTLVIPHGVDVNMFSLSTVVREPPSSRRLNTLIFVGQVDRQWGVELALRALSRLKGRADLRLMIVGTGPHEYVQYVKGLSSRLAVQDQVVFCGMVPYRNVPELLSKADVGLAPYPPSSAAEFGLPLKIKEYCASGLPVVCTQVGEIPKFIKESNAGLASRYDEGDFADAILCLIEDDALYCAKSESGKIYAKKFDWSALFEKEWQVVRSLGVFSLR